MEKVTIYSAHEVCGAEYIKVETLAKTACLKNIIASCDARYMLFVLRAGVQLSADRVEQFVAEAERLRANWLYADFDEVKKGVQTPHPLIDAQLGSLCNDFDFGALVLVSAAAAKEVSTCMSGEYRYAAFYEFRLLMQEKYPLTHLPKSSYVVDEDDLRLSGEKQFDYVDPRNREVQIEMEDAATQHLKRIGAFVAPSVLKTCEYDGEWPVEASVVIPVRNRVRTIADAIKSVLQQRTQFSFNVLVVDNHSTDGTAEAVANLAAQDNRVVLLCPQSEALGIGGCWMYAVQSQLCGKFAVQLDSDDLYSDNHTLQRVIDEFYDKKSAMVIGSYQMVDFDLGELPPGIIDHREWTDENGTNNALRINGFGAPRAFFTEALRNNPMPNVSYGEDYAVCLRLSAQYRVARIFEPIYLCRRWQGNSDAALSQEQINAHNKYKDSVRTMEIELRKKRNKQ